MPTFSHDALAGKVAIVTGAARGIGRCAAIALAEAGASVAGLDLCAVASPINTFPPATRADLDETGRLVEAAGTRWLGIIADQRDIGALRDAVEQVGTAWGGIDILFANTGIQAFRPSLEMDDADWHDQIDCNLNDTANAIRAVAPALVTRGGGRIIVTSLTQGQHGTLNGASYIVHAFKAIPADVLAAVFGGNPEMFEALPSRVATASKKGSDDADVLARCACR